MSALDVYSPGLEGVIAGETAVSTLEGGLRYRGYPVTELCDHATYDEVAYLLLYGELPTKEQLAGFHQRLAASRQIPDVLRVVLRDLPADVPSMDVVRTAVSILAHYDPEVNDSSPEANIRKAERLLGQTPVAVAMRYRFLKHLPPVEPRADLNHAASFLYLVRGVEPSHADCRAFDISLILYAENEFNASTFTARVVCSTESDLHSSIVAAIGALKGRLHGGANEKVMDLLRAAGGPETATGWIKDALARKERIMGFGHRVYRGGDSRAAILKAYARKAAEETGETKWEATAQIIEDILEREKNLMPNLDWPAGRLYHTLGLEVPLYTPIFVLARLAGWSAHVIEQMRNNRLIRPRGRYVGPENRSVKPIAERG